MDPHQTLGHVAVDFEGFYDKEVSITTLGAWGYLHHPKTDIYLVAIHDGEQTYVGHPSDFDWTSIAGRHWVSHNRSFDRLVYEVLVEKELVEDVEFFEWDCTADMSVWCRCMRNLKDACKFLLGKDISKSVRNAMRGLTPAQMKELVMAANGKLYPLSAFAKEVQAELLLIKEDGFDSTFFGDVCRYAKHDAELCWELWAKHAHKWPEKERRISRLTGKQGSHGIQMDRERLNYDLEVLEYACQFAKAQLPWAVELPDDKGVLSLPQLKKAIIALGLPAPTTTSEDSEVCRQWELAHPKCKLVKFMRDFRKANILRRRYQHVLGRLKPNGRYPFAWLYGGAHTLRWAGGSSVKRGGTGEKGFNVQNMPKEPLYVNSSGELVTADDPHDYIVDLRACCIVAKGKKWICADAEQIEGRIQLWLAREWEALKKIAAGMSIYEVHARKAMGWTGGNLKKEDPKKQFMAKNRVLALGFGCGGVKFHDRCRELGFPIELREAKKQVREFRNKERKIVACWYAHHNAIEAIAKRNTQIMKGLREGTLENYVITLPSGRQLIYFEPHYYKQKPKEGEEKPNRYKGDQIAARTELGGRIKFFYGGLIFENEVQAIARDILCEMMLALDDEGIPMLFSVHDEEDLEADKKVTCARVKEIMDVQLPWAAGLPISVEVNEGTNYFK